MMIADVFVSLFVGHQLGDYWVQTDHQAANKGRPGWAGRLAAAGHVATYTLVSVAVLVAVALATDLDLDPVRVAGGMLVSAVSHYVADRREPLRKLAELAGRGGLYRTGHPRAGRDDNPTLGTGAHALDQSFHYAWTLAAALVIAA